MKKGIWNQIDGIGGKNYYEIHISSEKSCGQVRLVYRLIKDEEMVLYFLFFEKKN